MTPIASTALFDKMPDAVACYERDGTIVYANPVTCGIFGEPCAGLVGRNLWQLFGEARGNAFHLAFERVATTGGTEHFENYYAPWKRWYDNHVYLADERVWVVGRDITEEKRAAARLETLAWASRAFAEAALDLHGVFDRISRHVAETLHCVCSIRLRSADGEWFEAPVGIWDPDDEILGLLRANTPLAPATDGAGGEVLRTGAAVVIAAIDPRAVAERIAPSPRRDFVTRLGLHSVIVAPLKVGGEIIGLLSVARRANHPAPFDEADRQLVEELADRAALVVSQWRTFHLVEEARARLAMIGDTLPVFLALIDSGERYRFVNAMYRQWFGREPQQILGMSLRDVLGAATYDAVIPHVREVLAGRAVTHQLRVAHPAGGERDFEATYTPYVIDGRVEGYIAMLQDVSERKQHEAALTAAIAQRDEFLSIASHELRTPLTAMSLQLDALRQEVARAPAGDRRDHMLRKLERAGHASDRIDELVEGLLDVSRVARGTMQLELDVVDLDALVRDVVERLAERATRVGSHLAVVSTAGVVGRWDRNRLDQALANIVANAIKYGAGQPIEIRIAPGADGVAIEVRDRGIGISASDQARIFDRFERAVSAKNYGGLGVGLYLAREIVVAHGGRITVDSELARGSVFTVELPQQASQAP